MKQWLFSIPFIDHQLDVVYLFIKIMIDAEGSDRVPWGCLVAAALAQSPLFCEIGIVFLPVSL